MLATTAALGATAAAGCTGVLDDRLDADVDVRNRSLDVHRTGRPRRARRRRPRRGAVQGREGRVQRLDEGKDQVTVELYEATVPIPVTVRGDQIRVLDSEER